MAVAERTNSTRPRFRRAPVLACSSREQNSPLFGRAPELPIGVPQDVEKAPSREEMDGAPFRSATTAAGMSRDTVGAYVSHISRQADASGRQFRTLVSQLATVLPSSPGRTRCAARVV